MMLDVDSVQLRLQVRGLLASYNEWYRMNLHVDLHAA